MTDGTILKKQWFTVRKRGIFRFKIFARWKGLKKIRQFRRGMNVAIVSTSMLEFSHELGFPVEYVE